MNDETFEAQRARIQALIEQWHAPLGLKWWTVTHAYGRSIEDMPVDSPQGTGSDVLAKCQVDWEYLRARVTWNLQNVADCDDEYLEKAFVHECMHIIVNEMRFHDEDLKHEERVCTVLANAFLWTRGETPDA